MLADGDHGIDETGRVLEHEVEIVAELGGQARYLPAEMGVRQNIALNADGMVELGLLHLRSDGLHGLLDVVFLLLQGFVADAELGAAGEDLRQGLNQSVLAEVVMVPGVGVVHDVLLTELGRVGVVAPDAEGDDADHDDQVGHLARIWHYQLSFLF